MHVLIVVVVTVVVVAAVVTAALLRPKPGGTKRPPAESCTIDTAWERYTASPSTWAPRRLPDGAVTDEGPVRSSLAETADRVAAAPQPVAALRQAIMDATDRFIQAETMAGIGPAGGAAADLPDYVPSVLEAGVLRCYAMLRYEDFAPDDWYPHYLKTAEMSARNVAGIVRKTVRGEASSIEGALHDPLMDAMREVRTALLHHPPRTPVRRADKLTHKAQPTKAYPSQEQIDRLIGVMSERFEKLFSGLVYQGRDGAAIDPAGAFQVDAALLYMLLAVHFRHPLEGWRQIMDKSLGQYRSAMQNEDRMLAIGQACHGAWSDNPQGRLPAAMRASCGMAFGDADDAGEAARTTLAPAMMADAQILVGAISDVVAKPGPGWSD